MCGKLTLVHKAPCLTGRTTREVNVGILVVESWLISATEHITTDNAQLWPRMHVDTRSGLARVDQLARHAKPKS